MFIEKNGSVHVSNIEYIRSDKRNQYHFNSWNYELELIYFNIIRQINLIINIYNWIIKVTKFF